MANFQFNPPPGWPIPPAGWVPEPGWTADPTWPAAPNDWIFWIPSTGPTSVQDSQVPAEEVQIIEPPITEGNPDLESMIKQTSDVQMEVSNLSTAAQYDRPQPRHELEEEEAELAEVTPDVTRNITPPIAPPKVSRSGTRSLGIDELAEEITKLREEYVELNDAVTLQQVGLYEYRHPLENSTAYKERLDGLKQRTRIANKSGTAISASETFSYNNSLAEGRKFVSDFSKLMLRAYNAEADNCVRSLRAGSLQSAIKRLDTSSASIARLGAMMEMRVSHDYHALRIEELELTADYLAMKLEERERLREERERLQEERKAAEELAAERERLDKQAQHYQNAIAVLLQNGKDSEAADLQSKLDLVEVAIADNDYRTANIRAGYVYVISNVGAFGPNVVKIGMTRRLEPMDRVRELGDASVPFPFDVHALFFADDAVTLENDLHKEFASLRVNRVNLRREFFFATPGQVRDVVTTKVGALLEFTSTPEAMQFNQSRGYWPSTDIGPELLKLPEA